MVQAATALTAFLLAAQAQPPLTPADQDIRKYLARHAAELEKDFLPGIKTAADFHRALPELRRRYFHMLGLGPEPERTPLKATVTGTLELPGLIVEKLHYQSRPGLYVTASLYRPAAPGRYPAILYQCGHSNMKRDGNKSAYQDHGIWFAKHGYVCLVTDTLQLGEIAAIHHGTYREQRWVWHSTGYTSAGVECWNGIRGIDYLQSRPDVDPERIGATGLSGGGAATFWVSAADERVKASAPVSGMADLGFYVAEDGVDGHCDCMFLYNTERWNWTTIAGLICPRPLLFVNSDADPIFPMSANERVIARLERLYSRLGASDKVDAMISVGGHAYRTDLRRGIFEFFNRTLKNDASPVTDPDAGLAPDGKGKLIEPSRLRVFPGDLPADEINTKVDETFVAVAKPELPKAGEFEAWKLQRLDRLRRECFGHLEGGPFSQTDAGGWILSLDSETAVPAWAREALGDRPATPYPTRGSWTRKNPPNTIERAMALVGVTADSFRVGDLMRHTRNGRIAGRGEAGILAAYAALLDPSVREVLIVDPPVSHRQGPHFLGVLRIWDIPDALGALAPRPLTLIGAKDPAFDRTVELYRLAGAADKLTRK